MTKPKNAGDNSPPMFMRFMRDTIDRLKRLHRVGTAKNYATTLHSFERFRGGTDVALPDVTAEMMEEYEAFLKDEGLTPNTTSFYMRTMRAVYNRAVALHRTADCRPFGTVYTGIGKTVKRAVSASDIRAVRDADLSGQPLLQWARDIFMFLFYCRGMSFVDAAYLRREDVDGDILTYRRHKTGRLLQIGLNPQMRDIISRTSQDSPYLLPIITQPGIDERKQYTTALRRVNRMLKTVAAMAGVNANLSTYTTRHTWATIAHDRNVPLAVISDALGHDSENTTRIYLSSIGTAEIDKANALVIDSL